MKQNLIITFDYELFLGKKCGTAMNSVIKPTKEILEVLHQNNAKAIFFVDATWLLFLQQNCSSDLELVSTQLKEIVRQGSSVELHLHPQWINAYSKGDAVIFDSGRDYNLHSFRQEEIIDLFRRSIDLLESITLRKIRCFRAGGFCIEPFKQIKEAFEMFRIKYDFSVAPGVYLRTGNIYDFDFTDAPKLDYYAFQYSTKMADSYGEFIEFPLSTYFNNPLYRLANKVLVKLTNDRIKGDGIGIQQELPFIQRLISKKLGFSKTFLTFDQMNNILFKFIIKTHFRKNALIVIISHPKTFTAQGLINLSYVTKNYNTLDANDLDLFLENHNHIKHHHKETSFQPINN